MLRKDKSSSAWSVHLASKIQTVNAKQSRKTMSKAVIIALISVWQLQAGLCSWIASGSSGALWLQRRFWFWQLKPKVAANKNLAYYDLWNLRLSLWGWNPNAHVPVAHRRRTGHAGLCERIRIASTMLVAVIRPPKKMQKMSSTLPLKVIPAQMLCCTNVYMDEGCWAGPWALFL